METLVDVRSTVRQRFGEASEVRLTDARLTAAINAGLDEVAENTGFRETFAVLELKKNRTYYDLRTLFPDEPVTITSIWSPDLNLWLRYTPTSLFTLNKWEITNGSPQHWFMRGLFHLGLFPHESTNGAKLHLYFTARHKPLVNDVDPVDVPPDLVTSVADYALFDLHLQERAQAEKAKLAYENFVKGLSSLDYHTRNRVSRPRVGHLGGRR